MVWPLLFDAYGDGAPSVLSYPCFCDIAGGLATKFDCSRFSFVGGAVGIGEAGLRSRFGAVGGTVGIGTACIILPLLTL